MRFISRILVVFLTIVAVAAAVYAGMLAVKWAQTGGLGLDRSPEQPAVLPSLDRYAHKAAGKAWFGRYFATMVFPEEGASPTAPVVAKWERPVVAIKLLNDGGPGTLDFLRRLVRRLDRVQGEVRFVVGGPDPRITIRFLGHRQYMSTFGDASVGTTRTRYFRASPGLISAAISIDMDRQSSADQLHATLIHELTHAIGCPGHFTSPADVRRSVLYSASHITSWSENDAAVIRVLYSHWIRSGMSPAQVRAGLRDFARSGG